MSFVSTYKPDTSRKMMYFCQRSSQILCRTGKRDGELYSKSSLLGILFRLTRSYSYLYHKKLCERTIKQLLNSVFAKYRDLSVVRRLIICRCRRQTITCQERKGFLVSFPCMKIRQELVEWTIPLLN